MRTDSDERESADLTSNSHRGGSHRRRGSRLVAPRERRKKLYGELGRARVEESADQKSVRTRRTVPAGHVNLYIQSVLQFYIIGIVPASKRESHRTRILKSCQIHRAFRLITAFIIYQRYGRIREGIDSTDFPFACRSSREIVMITGPLGSTGHAILRTGNMRSRLEKYFARVSNIATIAFDAYFRDSAARPRQTKVNTL